MTAVVAATGEGLVAHVARTDPDAVRLATLVSLAVRIEPGLLRQARLSLAPDLPTAVEANLWFSPLVESRTTGAIVLDDVAAGELRVRLMDDRELAGRAHDVLEWAHRDGPPTIKLEEEIVWRALTGASDQDLIELLARALITMTDEPGRGRGIARWASRAVPSLPEAARESSCGQLLVAGARAHLGLPAEVSSAGSFQLSLVLPSSTPRLDVGVRLLARGIRVSEPPAAGSMTLSVPHTEPLVLRLRPIPAPEPPTAQEHVIVVERGSASRHAAGSGAFSGPDGYEILLSDGTTERLQRLRLGRVVRFSEAEPEPEAETWRKTEPTSRAEAPPATESQSLTELIEQVRRAEQEGSTVHALDSGPGARGTPGHQVRWSRLRGRLELDDGTLRSALGPSVRVLAGTTLAELGEDLEHFELALPTTPDDDRETIGRAVATSGHGSSLALAPLPDFVRSLDLVASGGEVLRIEPQDGPSDPERFAARYGHGRRLIQDDQVFWAAVCGVGAMGVVHSLVLEVRDSFWLEERRELTTWEALRDRLRDDRIPPGHFDVLLAPYADREGHHVALVTRREEVAARKRQGRSDRLRQRASALPFVALATELVARFAPKTLARALPTALRRIAGDSGVSGVDVAYRLLDAGPSKVIAVESCELAVPIGNDRQLEAVEVVLETAAELRDRGLVHTGPLLLGFTGPSRAFASMSYRVPVMTIQIALIRRTRRGGALLDEHERRLERFGARPHWGRYHSLTDPRRVYPRWDDWLRVEGQLNASGVFKSPLTERTGTKRALS